MTPGITQESHIPTPRANNDWLRHTWRLVGWNLKLARRRLMSKILLAILLTGFALVMLALLGLYLVLNNASTASLSTGCPATPVATSTPGSIDNTPAGCDPETIQQEQAALQSARDQELAFLTFPTVLAPVSGYLGFMGIILLCILAGALVGNEYSFGTQRLALSRGLSRAQVLVGQVGALAALALIVSGAMLMLSALIGFTLGPLLGGSISDIPPIGLLQILGFWLVISLHLFAYALIALLLATLGRSSAAGIAGSLGYVLFETIVVSIVTAVAFSLSDTTFGDALSHVPAFFLGPNLDGLLSGVNQSPLDLGGASSASSSTPAIGPVIAPLQGLFVALLYCVVLVGLSYWALRKRDVTH
jgi:ABC-type transport system involved in multi-copper enzyme maturation permease subunit